MECAQKSKAFPTFQSKLKMGYKVKIQETNRGQRVINIPKVVSALYNLKKGMECEWTISDGELILKLNKKST